jgi:hypothetical protein
MLAVICGLALQWTDLGRPDAEAQSLRTANRILRSTSVGFRLTYPLGWKVVRQVVATEFAAGAVCKSVRIVDFEPPPDSGPGAQVLQSFVQLCWKRVSGGESLTEFVEKTYGDRASRLLERIELGRLSAYRTKGNRLNTTIFLQTDAHRLQIVAVVVAEPAKVSLRRAQVQRILESFSLTR